MPLLSETNTHLMDGLLRFEDPGHRYYYTPTEARVRKSMTGILKPFFDTFDGRAVATRGLKKWLRDDTTKYWSLCNYLKMVQGATDEQIVDAICKLWDANGNAAAAEGTKMHEDLELFIQDMLPPPSKDQEAPTACAAYLGMLEWFYPDQQLEPWRCEFPIVLAIDEVVVACGTVDFIMRSKKTGKYWILDWKHTNPKKKGLLGKRKANAGKSFFPPDMAKGMFGAFEATDYNKYSAQLLGYKYMLTRGGYFKPGEIAGCYIVQIHEDLDKANVVEVNDDDDFQDTVIEMMEAEVAEANREAFSSVEIGDGAANDTCMFDAGDGRGPQPVASRQTGAHSYEIDANF